jgi:hypothetical protein
MNKLYIYFAFLLIGLSHHLSFSQCSTVPTVQAVRNGTFDAGYIAGDINSSQTYGETAIAAALAGGSCHYATGNKYYISNSEEIYTCEGTTKQGTRFSPDLTTIGRGGSSDVIMYVDPVATTGPILWEQNVSVFSGQTYYFSFWANQITTPDVAYKAFVNGTQIALSPGTTQTTTVTLSRVQLDGSGNPVIDASGNYVRVNTTQTVTWTQYNATWPSGVATSATLTIKGYDKASGGAVASFGSDLALDDISFINSCQNLVTAATVTPNIAPTPGLNICTTNGSISLNSGVTAGGTKKFYWYQATGASTQTLLNTPNNSANTYSISAPGTYRVCIEDPAIAGFCAATDEIIVTNTLTGALNPATICSSSSPTTLDPGVTGSLLNYAWTKDGSPIGGNTSTLSASASGAYRVTITPQAPINVYCPTLNLGPVTVSSVEPVLTVNSSPCGATVTAPTPGTFTWYRDATTNTISATGNTYNPAVVASNPTFYVENTYGVTTTTAGKTMSSVSYENGSPSPQEVLFTLLKTQRLTSISNPCKYAQSGNITITNTVTSATYGPFAFSTAAGSQGAEPTIALNVSLPAGSYRLSSSTSCSGAMTDGSSQPSAAGVVTSITKDGFIKLVFKDSYNCPRVPVTIACALPVEYVSFNATLLTPYVWLDWSTATEENNHYFAIMKSKNGVDFDSIGVVYGHGTTGTINHYSYEDPASAGVTYYRLKQMDINGDFSWSKINVINNSTLTGSAYSVHPNPSSDAFQIRSISDTNTPSSIRITDARGMLVSQQEHLFNGSALTVGESLAKGFYILEITSTTDRFVQKLIKE